MNVSSSFSNFGAFHLLLITFLVLTMTLDDALAKEDAKPDKAGDKPSATGDKKDDKKAGKDGDKAKVPGLDVPTLVSDIIGSRRTVLVFASYSTRLLVIVSASDQTGLTTDSVVFEQPFSSLTDSLTLTSGQLLKDKWPKLTPTAGPVAVLCDSNCYLTIANDNSKTLTLLNLATKDVVSGQPIQKGKYNEYFHQNILLSSSEAMAVSSLFHADSNIEIKGGKFVGNTLTASTDIRQALGYLYLCNSGQKQFTSQSPPSHCTKALPWKITAGCIIGTSVFLVDKTSSSIIKFDTSTLKDTQLTKYNVIPFTSFWATPTTTTKATTITIRTSTKSHSSIWLIIGVSLTVLLIVACITGVLIYFFCCKKSKKGDPKKDASLKSTSQVKSKVNSSAGGDGTKIAKKYSTAGTATVLNANDGVVASPGATKESAANLPKLAFTMAKSSDVIGLGAPKSTPKGIIPKGRKASKGSRKRFEGKAGGKAQAQGQMVKPRLPSYMPEKKASGGKLTRQGTSKRRVPSPK